MAVSNYDRYPEGFDTPEQRARYDYKRGLGQDDNPYPREGETIEEHDRYAWEMHRLWSIDFDNEIEKLYQRKRRRKVER